MAAHLSYLPYFSSVQALVLLTLLSRKIYSCFDCVYVRLFIHIYNPHG